MAAPANNQNAVGNQGGQPTKFKPEYVHQAYRLCLLGAIDTEIAQFFGVSRTTLNKWYKRHEAFTTAVRRGKIFADMEIAQSLFITAIGRYVTEKIPFVLREVNYKDGKRVMREYVQIVEVERYIPGNYAAQVFLLKNRQPELWRENVNLDHTTKGQSINQINLGAGVIKIIELTDSVKKGY